MTTFAVSPGSRLSGLALTAALTASAALVALLPASPVRAAEINLATLTCVKYENELLPASAKNPDADSLDTVMWLFGYAVAKSGKHVLYTDALPPFGFALDDECKSNPAESMLDALAVVKPETKNPMDLSNVQCGPFSTRHAQFARSDEESAKSIMMWLFGFTAATSGGHLFDASARPSFEAALLAECAKRPDDTLLDVLKKLKWSKPKPAG
ncbi:MAG TPA: hypothetical protein VHV81_18080 [Steroidobacteraceae bacterium]|jgi:hypothetical protein|nr:hypothetical protein [Steroidobacteraceae bacterium]